MPVLCGTFNTLYISVFQVSKKVVTAGDSEQDSRLHIFTTIVAATHLGPVKQQYLKFD